MDLELIINAAYNDLKKTDQQKAAVEELLDGLDSGVYRAAEKIAEKWQVNTWVKKGILLAFRLGEINDQSIDDNFRFFDKQNIPLKKLVLKVDNSSWKKEFIQNKDILIVKIQNAFQNVDIKKLEIV